MPYGNKKHKKHFNILDFSMIMKTKYNFNEIKNPILNYDPHRFIRDPAMIFYNGVFKLFFSAGNYKNFKYNFYLEMSESKDLINWSKPIRIIQSKAGFSSPGNIIKYNNKWVLCVQTYPIPRFKKYASNKARLWLLETNDLSSNTWSDPIPIKIQGCTANWTNSKRQIDPYLIEMDGEFYCLYKTSSCLGILKSKDLINWKEASPNTPILKPKDLPINVGIENPCIIEYKGRYIMFFAPTRKGRGIGIAKSDNLLDWFDIEILEFPKLEWAPYGPTAPFVLDLKKECGYYLMAYHGEIKIPHNAAIGLAWSKDLFNWNTN